MSDNNNRVKLSKETMLKEYEFLIGNKLEILRRINSNRVGVNSQFKILTALAEAGLDEIEELVEFDIGLSKINTYINIGYLNNVEDNDLEIKYITRLPSLFFKMHMNKLKILKRLTILGENNQLHCFPAEIGNLNNLRELEISDCQLEKIPKEIGMLMNLEKLDLSGNHFFSLPREIENLKLLRKLNICHNPLLAELPEELGSLEQLEILVAHHDSLVKLPASVGKLHRLKELDLDYNYLTELPPEMGELSHLEILKANHNQLKTLPKELHKILSLKVIEVKDNQKFIMPAQWSNLIH